MNRTAKIWLIIAGILVLLGPILIVCATMANGGFSFGSAGEYVTVSEELGSTFDQIAVETNITQIEIATADEKQCRVDYSGPETIGHNAQVKDGTLVISSTDSRQWYENISLFTAPSKLPKLRISLPEQEYGSLQITTQTGDVKIGRGLTFDTVTVNGSTSDIGCSASVKNDLTVNMSTGDVTLSGDVNNAAVNTSTGDVDLVSVAAKGSISVSCSTGDITFDKTTAVKSFLISCTTGDVLLKDCDASELTIKTTTGDVSGTLLSDKVFVTDSSTGDISVPDTTSGGKCEITTTTGDVRITIE